MIPAISKTAMIPNPPKPALLSPMQRAAMIAMIQMVIVNCGQGNDVKKVTSGRASAR
jgi:hypothetical protein